VRSVVARANLYQGRVTNLVLTSEMTLQQSVYPPIGAVMTAFCPTYDCYKSDQNVDCIHRIFSKHDTHTRYVRYKPDGAVIIPGVNHVATTMELTCKSADRASKLYDVYKCVIVTSMSLWVLSNRDRSSTIAVPFIIGVHDTAKLYVTRYRDRKIVVEQLYCVLFDDVEDTDQETNNHKPNKTLFLAAFAILLSRITTVVRQCTNRLRRIALELRDDSPRRASDVNVFSSDGKTASKRASTSGDRKPCGKTPRGDAKANEHAAREVASCNGHVQELDYPLHRFEELCFDEDKSDWDRDMEYYQQESPFYFRGVLDGKGRHDRSSVFCKVWREGDRRTNRETIADEISFFKEAERKGVPTPMVIHELTRMDIRCTTKMDPDGAVYHMLVTVFEQDDKLKLHAVPEYALSLVKAVRKLHSIGLLHCDIKPGNTLWNAETQKVVLIDFGHSQRAKGARTYSATDKYQAPEVLKNAPHSKESDSFSVGKVLDEALRKLGDQSVTNFKIRRALDAVRTVATLLTRTSAVERITLDEAETQLTKLSGSPDSVMDSFPDESLMLSAQESLVAETDNSVSGGSM
jgi:serine/threonine protein kinase